jgi:hypothetical protein
MDAQQYDARLQSFGIGKRIFGTGNLLFDREYRVIPRDQFERANNEVRMALDFYFKRQIFTDANDCDTFHVVWLGRMREWFLKHDPLGRESYTFGITWGTFNNQPHMWGFYVGEELCHCNYGKIVTPDTFISKGSINV